MILGKKISCMNDQLHSNQVKIIPELFFIIIKHDLLATFISKDTT